jgi:hypothetical protein
MVHAEEAEEIEQLAEEVQNPSVCYC